MCWPTVPTICATVRSMVQHDPRAIHPRAGSRLRAGRRCCEVSGLVWGCDVSGAVHTPGTPLPVAYLYQSDFGDKELILDCNSEYARRRLELGDTETPLYASVPTLQATIDELVGAGNALKFHAGHSRECDFYQPIGVCDCGFADAEDHFNALAAKHKAPAQ